MFRWNLELANGRGFRLDDESLEGLCFATRRNAATAGVCSICAFVKWRSNLELEPNYAIAERSGVKCREGCGFTTNMQARFPRIECCCSIALPVLSDPEVAVA